MQYLYQPKNMLNLSPFSHFTYTVLQNWRTSRDSSVCYILRLLLLVHDFLHGNWVSIKKKERIYINTEVTATSFFFTKSVFCLRKPEATVQYRENNTRAPVGRIGINWRIGFTLYIVIWEVYIIGWVHFGM